MKWIIRLCFAVITIGILYCIIWLDLNALNDTRLMKNIRILSAILFLILPLIILVGILLGLLTKKWALKIEKVSLGGFNLLFDNPVKLYIRAVRSFLDTKRTLFYIDFERDNFDETLTSYYKTYEFFRNEMKVLENEKKSGRWNKKEQQELYQITNKIIHKLNDFLTTYQNNFRRWYKYVSDKNEVKCIGSDKSLEFHMTPISEIQKQYYQYNELCSGFKEINDFFENEVNKHFQVNIEKWKEIE
ncbi:hypothetical protein O9H85_18265 [Paenibacillus filicis]|uniref:Uncharacterized protein n=1 Tax=Paenibacillus gyeongsangnamensis TaxID=3388067 RepID=A0ABT4QBY5_9BACL|nr:hypothetical protein [Paenibacillus filicis]MCZ8514334.1 hypothetical protein [Paenibacillus filicis]